MDRKTCPFCGANADLHAVQGRNGWFAYIECSYCGARSKNEFAGRDANPYFGKDGEGPWFHWNKRVGPGTVEELTEIGDILCWLDDFALVLSTDFGLEDDEADLFDRKRHRLRGILYSVLSVG